MTQHRTEYRPPYIHQPQPQGSENACALQAAVFGTVFFEVVLRPGSSPAVPGWTLRLWPQARLGDATLEATPDQGQRVEELVQGLKSQGVQPLGPVRYRRI